MGTTRILGALELWLLASVLMLTLACPVAVPRSSVGPRATLRTIFGYPRASSRMHTTAVQQLRAKSPRRRAFARSRLALWQQRHWDQPLSCVLGFRSRMRSACALGIECVALDECRRKARAKTRYLSTARQALRCSHGWSRNERVEECPSPPLRTCPFHPLGASSPCTAAVYKVLHTFFCRLPEAVADPEVSCSPAPVVVLLPAGGPAQQIEAPDEWLRWCKVTLRSEIGKSSVGGCM